MSFWAKRMVNRSERQPRTTAQRLCLGNLSSQSFLNGRAKESKYPLNTVTQISSDIHCNIEALTLLMMRV
jgi:hypothetical protein